ncbi:MAG: hypothetical protein IJ504_03760 [Bacteroidales bacterium]|nr:hypothetical protein [Bacteroidales bacterium]
MKRFGLIGHPIAHSLSPALFKAGYDGRYPYELIETADFEEAYSRFLEGYDGINVTAPFKELAFAKADILSEECKVIKATNLLVKTPEGVKAYNSDYLGVQLYLKEMLLSLSGISPGTTDSEKADKESANHLKALIIGLGGAGKAAGATAESLGMEVVRMNRTIKGNGIRPLSDFRECFRDADIVIYNIPAPISQLDELTEEDLASGKPKAILEANYKDPSFTEDMIRRMTGINPLIRYTSGRKWLLYQALTGYEIFTGEKPDLKKMSDVL